MQQETVQVLLDPPLPSALPLLHFREGEEGLVARLTSQGLPACVYKASAMLVCWIYHAEISYL